MLQIKLKIEKSNGERIEPHSTHKAVAIALADFLKELQSERSLGVHLEEFCASEDKNSTLNLDVCLFPDEIGVFQVEKNGQDDENGLEYFGIPSQKRGGKKKFQYQQV